jgi:hypothetical protein
MGPSHDSCRMQCFAPYLPREDAHLVPWLAVAHSSPRVRNTNRPLWNDNPRAFDVGARITDTDNPSE